MRSDLPLAGKRVALVAAHPDDETIGAGGCLARLRDPFLIHVTDGAPRSRTDAAAYARARREELAAALTLARIDPARMSALGCVDQEAAFQLADLARAIRQQLEALRPEIVLTHPYEGGHPDHDAVAFAVRAACRLMAQPPEIAEFTSYHIRNGSMETGVFLPAAGTPEITVELDPQSRELKRRMFDCFLTQREMLDKFELETERYRIAPEYDFTAPPHAGRLFYEHFPWGMTADRWAVLTRQALAQLNLC